MERVRWETYKGKKILILDYSGLKAANPEHKKTIMEVIKTARDVTAQLKEPVLFLSDVTSSQANGEVMTALKEFARFTNERKIVGKECVVGTSAMQTVLLNAVNLFSGGSIKPFATVEQAKEWLAT